MNDTKRLVVSEDEKFFNSNQLSALLGRNRNRVRRVLDAANVPVVYISGRRAYRKRDIDAYLAALPTVSPNPIPPSPLAKKKPGAKKR